MKRLALRFFLLSLFQGLLIMPLFSQNPNGLLWEDEVYQQMEPLPYEKSVEDLPDSVSLRSYCPSPGDQGTLGSCTAWSVANALTISKCIKNNVKNQHNIDDQAHSVSYIFNQIKLDDHCSSAYLSAALRLLNNQGSCLSSSFRYSPDSCRKKPGEAERQQAANYKIESFQPLFRKDDSTYVKETHIQLALAYQYPVVVAMTVPADLKETPFEALDWSEENLVGHAMVVVGYNDCTKEFELMNSYGKIWNQDGFFRLPYDQFLKHVVYGYWIELGDEFGE